MAKGRELKGRIKSVENTRKITRTMEMVATSKMKRAQDRVVAARPYANSLSEVIANLYTSELAERFPLMRQPAAHTMPLTINSASRGHRIWRPMGTGMPTRSVPLTLCVRRATADSNS